LTGSSFGAVLQRGLIAAVLLAGLAVDAAADSDTLAAKVAALATGDFAAKEAIIAELASTGDPAAVPALLALGAGDLQVRKSDGKVVIAVRDGNTLMALGPATGSDLGSVGRGALERIRVNNNLRRAIRAAIGSLTLLSREPSVRRH